MPQICALNSLKSILISRRTFRLQSVEFHENGRKHQQNVQQRLKEITRKGAQDDVKAKRESEWLKKMEEDAMKAYRDKDLGGCADLTAKIFNEKRAERLAGEVEAKRLAQEAEKAAIAEHIRKHVDDGQEQPPQPSGSGPSSIEPRTAGGHEDREGGEVPSPLSGSGLDSKKPGLRRIEAPMSGTKWHNQASRTAASPKHWFEAVSEEGHTFYWHIESQGKI